MLNEVDPAANRSTANGATTVFPYSFEIALKTEIEVLVDMVSKTVDVDYTVSGLGNSSGGDVTFFTAPANASIVTRIRKQPASQLSDYIVNESVPAERIEADLDRITAQVQQMREQLKRGLFLPKSSALVDQGMDVPTVGSFARGKVGGGIDWATVVSAGSVSIPVAVNQGGTGATDAATARTNLGVPSNAEAILDTLIDAKGDLIVGTGNDTVARKAVGTDGFLLTAASGQSDGLTWAGPPGSNPIINGNMEVWQRGTTFAATTNIYTADRWKAIASGGTIAGTVNRATNVPTVGQAGVLFNYSLEIDVTTADATLVANEGIYITHHIEGYNWRHFAQRQFTVSFWVMSTKTGIHSFSAHNSGGDRDYIAEFTVNVSDTWEYKTITVAASPSAGTWNYTNGIGLQLYWFMAAGPSLQVSTLGSWGAGLNFASTNQVNGADNTANFFRITGVKMELGSVATPIQFVPFEQELARCMRYYQKGFPYSTTPAQNVGVGYTSFTAPRAGALLDISPSIRLIEPMRAAPAVTLYNSHAANAQIRDLTASVDLSGSTVAITELMFVISGTGNAATAVGNQLLVNWTAEADI